MPSDIRVMFHTAPGFVLSDFSLISNTEGCLYTNNKFANPSDDIVSSGARIVTRPASRIPTVHEDYGHITWSANGQTSKTEYTCPQISGKYVYVVDLRLNPLLAYKIDFLPTLLDEYGQHVSRLVSFSVKTGPIDPKDQYLYSSAAGGQTQVIPSSLPIILGLISANIDSAHIEVCEMDQEGYIAFR